MEDVGVEDAAGEQPRGVAEIVRRSQPRIHRLRYGSPGPLGAPRCERSETTSGHVKTMVAAV